MVTALAALIVERLIINRLRGAPVISLAIVTIGVDMTEAQLRARMDELMAQAVAQVKAGT